MSRPNLENLTPIDYELISQALDILHMQYMNKQGMIFRKQQNLFDLNCESEGLELNHSLEKIEAITNRIEALFPLFLQVEQNEIKQDKWN